MQSSRVLMKNTLLLAASGVILRGVGLCFQLYLAGKVGAEGLGIYGLIMSVYTVFATISISGIRFAVTRLTAEEMGHKNPYPRKIIRFASLYSLFFGFLSFLVLFSFSDTIANKWICHTYASLPLRILSASLPFVGLGGVFEGYFTAKQKILRLVSLQFLNQAVRIFCTVFLFNFVGAAKNHPCDVLSFSTLLGEVFFTVLSFLFCFLSFLGHKEKGNKRKPLHRILSVSVPLAISSYMRTGLSSLGHIIIPYGFRRAGMGSSGAFITYGVITQIAFPVIMFPSSLLSALGEILVPKITKAQVERKNVSIKYMIGRAGRLGIIFSFLVCGFMFFYPNIIGSFYKNNEATIYIRAFAPIIPIMYCDCVTDGCLKGLGEQLYCMILNIIEAIINIILLLILLPRFAIMGYIITMYVKEIFNTSLSFMRLKKVADIKFDAPMIITVFLSMLFSYPLSFICARVPLIGSIFYVFIYVTLLYIFNSVTREDIKWAFSLIKNKDG